MLSHKPGCAAQMWHLRPRQNDALEQIAIVFQILGAWADDAHAAVDGAASGSAAFGSFVTSAEAHLSMAVPLTLASRTNPSSIPSATPAFSNSVLL